ncbi:MAG: hypothetical protein GY839_11975 [candidate division Zixibacteria bacterium]|nr:hypothetical protein [candidate division Zixibacteria bacterium]
MKIVVVIGHLVWDRIVQPSGNASEALGGIAYSLTALGARAKERYKVYPICNVGYDLMPTVREAFGKISALDLEGIRIIPRRNKIHELTYNSSGDREEQNIGEMPTIKPLLFDRFAKIDVALINYIGGDEFPPRYLRWLKGHFSSLIYLDYHSLALGRDYIDKSDLRAKRFLRYNPHWKEYICTADIVQMNHYELKSIFPNTSNVTDSIIRSALKVKAEGPEVVVITREDKELIVVEGKRRKAKFHILPVQPVREVIDPTGCGDSFAAGFISSYIDNRDVLKASNAGLGLASKKVRFSGLGGFSL